METITIQFSRGRGILSSLVAWGTWSWSSHVDIVIPIAGASELLVGANAGLGVSLRNSSKVLADSKQVERYTVQVENKADVYNSALSLVGSGYDWMGILGIVSRTRVQNKNKFFCSEFVAHVLLENGVGLFNQPLHRITPRDLISSTKLSKV
ncbi:MAG: hypothetical protein GQ570_03995 [Helicobacteraceae bacterium]|nr:hypothetical protein [Helicobacteraceae bacterium]